MASTTTTAAPAILASSAALSNLMQSPALGAAAKAMGELGFAGLIGATYVHQKLITPEMIRALSKTIYTVLLPMFIGTNLMKTVVTQGGKISKSSLCVPMVAILQSAILYILAQKIIMPLVFDIDPTTPEGKVLAIVICFGNAGVLPFVFAEAMFRDNTTLLQQANSQVSFFSAGWSPFFWSFVPKILQISNNNNNKNKNNQSNKNNDDDTATTTTTSTLQRFVQEIKVFFPPPVIGVVTGTLIGLSPLSPLLLSSSSSSGTSPPPLAIVYNSFQNLGKAASPLAVLVLTCSLAFGATKKITTTTTTKTSTSTTSSKSPSLFRKWACVSTARFIISPLIMMGLLQGLALIGLIEQPTTEPMLWFVCLLQSIMPPAQNSVVLLQVAGRSDEASQMAKFLFSIYATAMLPIVALVTASLDALDIVP